MVDTRSYRPLFEPLPTALTALFGDVENFARSQIEVHAGTPGGLVERVNAGGFRFYAHQFYDARGKKADRYLAGPVGDQAADAAAAALRAKLNALGDVIKNIRLLVREGYKHVDSKTFATLATLHNHGLFRAGALFIGSHAFGALLNQIGVRAAQYTTQDVDIARSTELAFPQPPQLSFLEMLKTSGISFCEVPTLDHRAPSTSFMELGGSSFQVDLLVPSQTEDIGVVSVPELRAYAKSLPYLAYLLGDSQDAAVLAKEGCCIARVPTPERFAWHKLIVSQLRKRPDKMVKDIEQAAVLISALAERSPGALEQAAKAIPRSTWKYVIKAADLARDQLTPHPRALEILASLRELQVGAKPKQDRADGPYVQTRDRA